jgi:Flp pilus assembly protein TadG
MAPSGSGRSRERVGHDDRGSAELVVATPLLLLLILAVIQFAIYEHASQVAQTTAAQALAATRVVGGTTTAGQSEARSMLSDLGSGVIVSPQVSVVRGGTTADVTVSGVAEGVVPLLHLPVRATAAGPLERFVGGP